MTTQHDGDVPRGPSMTDAPVCQVQTDLLCRSCGANLHGQDIRRLADSGLLVVRCPRCGTFASAQEALPYRSYWRQQLGLTLMIGWMLAMGTLGALVVTAESRLLHETPMRRQVSPATLPAGARPPTDMPAWFTHARYHTEFDWPATRDRLGYVIPKALAIPMLAAGFYACALHHWRRAWLILAALGAPAGALFLFYGHATNMYFRPWLSAGAWGAVLIVAVCQMLGGVLGTILGRPAARLLIRLLLPPRARQHFAFLWRRDGKTLE